MVSSVVHYKLQNEDESLSLLIDGGKTKRKAFRV